MEINKIIDVVTNVKYDGTGKCLNILSRKKCDFGSEEWKTDFFPTWNFEMYDYKWLEPSIIAISNETINTLLDIKNEHFKKGYKNSIEKVFYKDFSNDEWHEGVWDDVRRIHPSGIFYGDDIPFGVSPTSSLIE